METPAKDILESDRLMQHMEALREDQGRYMADADAVKQAINDIKRKMLELKGQMHNLARQRMDLAMALEKAKSNLERVKEEIKSTRDKYFKARGEGL